MRILKIIPGSGDGFLCENCLRDQALVAELRWAGHDVLLVPLYLPIAGAAAEARAAVPLFYGAVRVFLEHRFAFLRRSPAWLRRWFDSPRVLRFAARQARTSSSDALADLTLSVLRGENGAQARELDTLCEWLRTQPRPDVVHISNALLLGLARRIRTALQVPVVCTLQDEDTWIDTMPGAVAKRIWSEMRARVPDIAAFIPVSHYFAAKMPRRVGIPPKIVRVVHPGLDASAYPVGTPPAPPVWGVCLDAGDVANLTRVLAAFLDARARPGCAALRLRVAGAVPAHASGQSAYDALRAELAARGAAADAEFLAPFTRHADRLAFLRSLSVFTVLHGVEPAFDLSVLEAMASGVAVLQPASGANPEILAMAEGGVLFDPARPESLVDALSDIVAQPNKQAVLAHQGRYGVEHGFSLGRMARETVEVYQNAIAAQSPLEAGRRRARAAADAERTAAAAEAAEEAALGTRTPPEIPGPP